MTNATTKTPKIYADIEYIQAQVGNIPKNGELRVNGQLRYTFVKNDDILEKINGLLKERRVIVRPEIMDVRDVSRPIGGEKVLPTVYLTLKQTYISVEDGSEFSITVAGEGGGADDKGLRKATTQAQKIANLLTFSIVTGEEDPDAQEPKIADVPARAEPAKADPTPAIRAKIKAKLGVPDGDPAIKASAEQYAESVGKALPKGYATNEPFLTGWLQFLGTGEV